MSEDFWNAYFKVPKETMELIQRSFEIWQKLQSNWIEWQTKAPSFSSHEEAFKFWQNNFGELLKNFMDMPMRPMMAFGLPPTMPPSFKLPDEMIKASTEIYDKMLEMWQKLWDPERMIGMLKSQLGQIPEEYRTQFSEMLKENLEGMKKFNERYLQISKNWIDTLDKFVSEEGKETS